jgi:GntR family transcriptional regulator
MSETHPLPSPLIDFLARALARQSGGVIYRELAQALRQAVTEDILAPGDVLPGERDLAEAIDISRTSVRKAIESLVNDGALIRRHGARTAVAERVEKPLSALTSFSEDMRSRGIEPGMIWISKEVATASPSEIMALDLSVGAKVCRLKRLRTGDGKPMAIEHAVVPVDVLADPAEVTGSLYEVLSRLDRRPVRALQRLRAAIASPEDSELLHLEPGAPLLVAERRCFTRDGTPIEFTRTLYCGTRYDFLVELRSQDQN